MKLKIIVHIKVEGKKPLVQGHVEYNAPSSNIELQNFLVKENTH